MSGELSDVVRQLGEEMQALRRDHDAAERDFAKGLTFDTATNTLQRLRVKELLGKLQKTGSATVAPIGPSLSPPDPPLTPAPKSVKTDPPVKTSKPKVPERKDTADTGTGIVDSLALAHALFRVENYERALTAYRLVDLTGMPSEYRAPIKYLMATCLRKLGKTEEALTAYREVANLVGSSRVDLQACKLEYSIVSPK